MKHTLIAGLTALITAATVWGAEPKVSTPMPATTRAVRPRDLGFEFIKNAKFGIFVHYTRSTPYAFGKPNPAVWDLDAQAAAFDVKAFADAVEDMGAQYVTMTAFHAAMYLIGPSKVMSDIGMPPTKPSATCSATSPTNSTSAASRYASMSIRWTSTT